MTLRSISFGYKLELGRLIILEEEAQIVKQVFNDYLGGKSLANIATELQERKIEYMTGCWDWNKNRVSRIIENRKYIGANGYPVIISEISFNQANLQKSSKSTTKENST